MPVPKDGFESIVECRLPPAGRTPIRSVNPGAKAVGIGRPFLWGLGAFGQAGVDRVLEILQGELKARHWELRHADGSRHHPRVRRHTRLETLTAPFIPFFRSWARFPQRLEQFEL